MNPNPLTAHRREALFNYSVIDGTRNQDDGTTEEVVWIGYDTKGAWLSLPQAEAIAAVITFVCSAKSMRLARSSTLAPNVGCTTCHDSGQARAAYSRYRTACPDCAPSPLSAK